MTDLTLEYLVEARAYFFRRWHSDQSYHIFLTNESRLLDLYERSQMQTALINLMAIPPGRSTFLDPVSVAPTQAQMSDGLIPVTQSTGSCAICQDGYTAGGEAVRLRNCGHTFHRMCANTWYTRSVYCPLCRNDIRVTSQPNTNG
jgi:hypothetical protein